MNNAENGRVIVREMAVEDMTALAALYEQFWGEESDVREMMRRFEEIQAAGTHILLCAEADGRMIGSVMGVVCAELYGGCQPFLVVENMIVDQTRRRAGVGRVLLAELERRAKRRGCTQAILVTELDRTGARRFYEANGYPAGKNTGYKKKL